MQRVALVDPVESTRESLRTLVLGIDFVWLDSECARYELFADVIKSSLPDLVIVALDADKNKALQLIRELSAEYPKLPILAISQDHQALLHSLQKGAQYFLTQPVSPEDILAALRRALGDHGSAEVTPRAPTRVAPATSVIAVLGSRGGVGTTTLAVNLAATLAADPNNAAALIDLDLALGDGDIALEVSGFENISIADVAVNIDRLDSTFLRRAMARHEPSGLSILRHPLEISQADRIHGSHIERIIHLLKLSYTHLVLDLSKGFLQTDLAAMHMADPILLVAQLELTSLRNVVRLLHRLGDEENLADKVRVIINRQGADSVEEGIGLKKAEEVIGKPIFWQIPNDPKPVIAARIAGEPLVKHAPKSRVQQSIAGLAQALSGKTVSAGSGAKAGWFGNRSGSRTLPTRAEPVLVPVPKTGTGLETREDELAKETARLQQERKQLDGERKQLREDEEALEAQMRELEVSMARERALLARQETELRQLNAEIQHELELMQRGDANLREQMAKFQRRAQEVAAALPTVGANDPASIAKQNLLERVRAARGGAPTENEPPNVPLPPEAPPGPDPLDCSVYSPAEVSPGQAFLVQVFAHRPEESNSAPEIARRHDAKTAERGFASLAEEVARNTTLDFHLSIRGFPIDPPIRQLVWRGRTAYVGFPVVVPEKYPKPTAVGEVTVSRNGVPLGQIAFQIRVAADGARRGGHPVRVPQKTTRYQKAFISYASKDRGEVLKRVDMLRLACQEFWQDLLDLEPGQRWEKELYKRIDECDLFILFWSDAARRSKWVRKEIAYAYERKRGKDRLPPRIFPVILGEPPPPKPPPQLAHMHLNDYLIYFRTKET